MPTPPRHRSLKLLHLEDSEVDHELALAWLARGGRRVQTLRVEDEAGFRAALEEDWDAVPSDYNLPGFSGLAALQILQESGRLLPFDFSLDKAFAGLLLALIAAQFHPQRQTWRFVWIAPAGAFGLFLLVLLLGHSLEPQWSRYTLALLFVNLVVTCFAEELFFRGALQRELMLYLAPLPAIAITALLFGLVHLGRGWEFSLLATLAGALYGTVYFRTGALSLAVLTHFAVNAGWILLFPSVR